MVNYRVRGVKQVLSFIFINGIGGNGRLVNLILLLPVVRFIIIGESISGGGDHSEVSSSEDIIFIVTEIRRNVLFGCGCINKRDRRVTLGVFF